MAAVVPTSKSPQIWQVLLTGLGLLTVVSAGALAVSALRFHQVTTQTTTPAAKAAVGTPAVKASIKTVTGPSAPSTTMIGTTSSVGAVLIVAGAFFDRLTKVVIGGLELDFDTAAEIAGTAAALTGGDKENTASIVRRATAKATARVRAQDNGDAIAGCPGLAPAQVEALVRESAAELRIQLV